MLGAAEPADTVWRQLLIRFVETRAFEVVIQLCIMYSTILMAVTGNENDPVPYGISRSSCSVKAWLYASEFVILIIFM